MRNAILITIICLMASCAINENNDRGMQERSGEVLEVFFSTEIAGEETVEVKSILSPDIESKVSDMTLASYGSDGRLLDVRYYSQAYEGMPLLVAPGELCNIYALVNMGDMSGEFPESESDVSYIEYHIPSYSYVDICGFPMSGILEDFSSESFYGIIPVQRLFAKLCVRITHKSLDGYSSALPYSYNMCNKSLYVRQANRRLLPFSKNGSKAVRSSDILSMSDSNQNLNDRYAYQGSLTNGGYGPGPGYMQDTTLVFYVPENVQGKLLPYNDDPFSKVYGEIDDVGGKSYADLCTYLEFNARRENTMGYSGDVMYRYYLGADNTSDFSLERNKRYDLTLDFTEEGFFAESWKVTRGGDWNDRRVLNFVGAPFDVQPGGSVDVMVHYHRSGLVEGDSFLIPDDWRIEVDWTAMAAAGLSYAYDPSSLVMGKNGFKDFCIKVSASSSAKVGASVPIAVVTRDGAVADAAVINVTERKGFSPQWDFLPEYVSQEGVMSFDHIDSSDLPLSVSVSDPSKISCMSISDSSFKVVASRTGRVALTVKNALGTKSVVIPLDIKAPILELDASAIALNPDGGTVSTTYRYLDAEGQILTNVNASAFDSFLLPVMHVEPYFSPVINSSSVSLSIVTLTSDGKSIELGEDYTAVLYAADCQAVSSRNLILKVKDPFDGMIVRDYGVLDDYTLFTQNGVPAALRNIFSNEVEANRNVEYNGFVPSASGLYVSVALEPVWTGGFSNPNGVFKAEFGGSGKIKLSYNTLSSSTLHSAGRHNMMVYVTNRNSKEKIGRVCGTVDVYVHTALGAKAVFGSQMCNYSPYGNETFASVYNMIAGRSIYPYPSSTSYIHYIDVTMEWMTDVSKVYVWNRMNGAAQTGNSFMDALEIVRPSVVDGQTDSNTRMLYSVMAGSDSRISVCGEKYGQRKGIGNILYRALLQPTYSMAVNEADLKLWFFGYQAANGSGAPAMAPCYTIHNLNKGVDMQNNKVYSRTPYYFSPSSCKDYVDDQGRGYHVIHFLEEISPYTHGWINLL